MNLLISRLRTIMTEKQSNTGNLDLFDMRILEILSQDGRMAVTELAKQIGLSKTPCQARLKRLVDEGYIQGFRAAIDPEKLGLDHIAFTTVKLSDTREKALQEFNVAVRKIREVEECHMIASSFDYLLKIRTPDIRRYRIVLGEKISSLPNVASTSTFVVMESVKDNRPVRVYPDSL
jgi:Lrp/AsnC family leucine-responsive transcriptional regulator